MRLTTVDWLSASDYIREHALVVADHEGLHRGGLLNLELTVAAQREDHSQCLGGISRIGRRRGRFAGLRAGSAARRLQSLLEGPLGANAGLSSSMVRRPQLTSRRPRHRTVPTSRRPYSACASRPNL